MAYIVLYWGVMIIGYFAGIKFRGKAEKYAFVDWVMMGCISLLVFLMGIRMGSNEEVIKNLGTIGLQALILTALLIAGTVAAVSIARRLLGFDRYGLLKTEQEIELDENEQAGKEGEKEGQSNLMTWLILIFVVAGLLAGYFVVRTQVEDLDKFNESTGVIMTVGLSVMLTVIGFDMGLTGTVIKHLKAAGLRVLAFPVVIMIGTGIVGVLISLVFPDLSLKETLAICYGFGWYTFAPVAITGEGYVIAGAISFMHNVFRELGGLMLIPVLAKKIGFIEVTSIPGVAAMDMCLPVVERATRQDILVYSFAIGMVESLAVPLLVPLIIGL